MNCSPLTFFHLLLFFSTTHLISIENRQSDTSIPHTSKLILSDPFDFPEASISTRFSIANSSELPLSKFSLFNTPIKPFKASLSRSIGLNQKSVKIIQYVALHHTYSQKIISDIHESINWTCYTRTVLAHAAIEPESLVFLFYGEQPVGYVIVAKPKMDQPKIATVPFIAVNKSEQRKGWGEALMYYAIQHTIENGYPYLSLEFRGNNESTRSFYKHIAKHFKLPYNEILHGQYANGDPKILLIYKLR